MIEMHSTMLITDFCLFGAFALDFTKAIVKSSVEAIKECSFEVMNASRSASIYHIQASQKQTRIK